MFVFDSDKLKYLIQELKEKLVLQTDFNDLEKIETSATEPNNELHVTSLDIILSLILANLSIKVSSDVFIQILI